MFQVEVINEKFVLFKTKFHQQDYLKIMFNGNRLLAMNTKVNELNVFVNKSSAVYNI